MATTETETVQEETLASRTSERHSSASVSDDAIDGRNLNSGSSFSIENLVARKRFKTIEHDKTYSTKARAYYKKQDEFIDSLVEYNNLTRRIARSSQPSTSGAAPDETVSTNQAVNEAGQGSEEPRLAESRRVQLFAKILLGMNIVLVCGKLVAAILSGSLAIVSVLVDNVVDLLSGLVIWLVNRAMIKHRPYAYPEGRRRLEPISIVILAVIMSVASIQVIITAIERIISLTQTANPTGPNMDWLTLTIIGVDIAVKLGVIFVFMRQRRNPSVSALMQDARNDVISNSVSILCGLLAYYFWPYLDPIGAIVISSYIVIGWVITLVKKVRVLVGLAADPAFIRRVAWLAVDHDERIKEVDTVRAFHVGSDLFVEVDIVLPSDMRLQDAHDIGEGLQQKIEGLPNVERAFVHLDYESGHNPNIEHKRA